MRLRTIALLAALASPLAMIAAGPTAAAAVSAPSIAGAVTGFAWIDGPGTAGATTSYDSAGGTVSATENTSGFFAVTFGGMAFSGGDVQVSGLDPQGSCVVQGWNPSGSDLLVNVACYHLGVPSDEQFDIVVTKPASAPRCRARQSREPTPAPSRCPRTEAKRGAARSQAGAARRRLSWWASTASPPPAPRRTGTSRSSTLGAAI